MGHMECNPSFQRSHGRQASAAAATWSDHRPAGGPTATAKDDGTAAAAGGIR